MANAGWYPDPRGGSMQRWFDGVNWTEALLDPAAAVPPATQTPGTPAQPPATGARETMAAPYPPQQGYQPQPAFPPQQGYPQPGYQQPAYPPVGYPQQGYQQPYAPRPASGGFQWWWLVIGAVLSVLVLQIDPDGRHLIADKVDYLEVLAAYLAGAGIAMSRARPAALGLVWGLASAVVFAVSNLIAREVHSEEVAIYALILFVAATLAAGIPSMAGAPRGLVWVGAALGAAVGAGSYWGYIKYLQDNGYENFHIHLVALTYSLSLGLAALGVLALGGRPAPSGPPAYPSYTPAGPGTPPFPGA